MNKKIIIGIISGLALALLGCGQMVKQTQPADSVPPINAQTGAQGSEVVLARSSVILNLGSAGVGKQSVDAVATQSVQVLADVNLVMPPMTTFQVSSNVSFNIKSNAVLEAGGQIDIKVFYNNVLETGLNKVFVRVRLLSGNGLSGKTITTSIIPLDMAVDAGSYNQLSSANLSVRECNKPFNDVIAQTLSLRLRGDFSRAISQQYQGTIVFELVKDVTPQQMQWKLAISYAPWTFRAGHTSIAFNNRMWIFGGKSYGGDISDIWSSPDGINWIQETASAAWPARFDHTSLVFNNRIWILGGFYNLYLMNDVWSSADGINWTLETVSAAWPARANHTCVVFNDKMWLIGGYANIGSGDKNDVWSSTDGKNWTQETAAAPWTAREGHTIVVFNNKMWILGGCYFYSASRNKGSMNDVWSSTDGKNWTQETAAAPWSVRGWHTSVVFNNKIWLLGGYEIYSGSYKNDVWSTSDGKNWTRETASVPWSARSGHTSVVFNNKIWLLGGGDDGSRKNDVWSYGFQ